MTDLHTELRVPGPRTTANATGSLPGGRPDTEPGGLTTFSAALARWDTRQGTPPDPPSDAVREAPRPRLLHDQNLPQPPPGLPGLTALQHIAQAAADSANRLLDGTPLPNTPLAQAVHIAANRPGTDTTPAYRLDIDLGRWRELVAAHHAGGCAAVQAITGT
ncbi:hypothetical protein AB0N09_05455 [Streptomyces erythrochromogenes]|uniref:hypothetical protein n=1 Tax=Streptomyces erythrochromogenes TaxID=285574 RepID=UPI00343D3A92